jgi:CRISPR-associated endoribonuclease Cas6
MPALMHVVLDSPRVVVHPKWLHGAACELFERSGTDHRAQDKPFSVGPVRGIPGGALWRLGWLADFPPPDLAGVVRFGRCSMRSASTGWRSFPSLHWPPAGRSVRRSSRW